MRKYRPRVCNGVRGHGGTVRVAALCALVTLWGGLAVAQPGRVIADGLLFPEGPAVGPDGSLYFADSAAHRIYRWDGGEVAVVTSESERSNGLEVDRAGDVYGCAGVGRAILRFTPEGQKSVYVKEADGRALNRPNDLVFDRRGNLYFTNPGGAAPCVVRVASGGGARVVATDPKFPNGIALSPDEKTLYVSDIVANCVWAYDLDDAGSALSGRVFAKLPGGGPDGMAVAASGNLYVVLHNAGKIVVLNPDGDPVREIAFPDGTGPTNVCFGGDDLQTLFVTVAGKPVRQLRWLFSSDAPADRDAALARLRAEDAAGKVYALRVDEPGAAPYALR